MKLTPEIQSRLLRHRGWVNEDLGELLRGCNLSALCGGAIASIIQGEDPRDYDIWTNEPVLQLWNNGEDYPTETKFTHTYNKECNLYQFIKEPTINDTIPSIERLLNSFDFAHCHIGMPLWGDTILVYSNFLPKEHILDLIQNKVLFYTGKGNPVVSLFRARKFMERGYTFVSNNNFNELLAAVGRVRLGFSESPEDILLSYSSPSLPF